MSHLSLFFIVCFAAAQNPTSTGTSATRTGSPDSVPAGMTAPATQAASFELTETQSRKFAYLEHTGPYWALGALMDQVGRDALARGTPGGIIVRYVEAASAAGPEALRAQVGFELLGLEPAPPAYQVVELPTMLAARRIVEGPDGLSTRHFASLKVWAAAQGLIPAGDLLAIVELAEGGHSTVIERAEALLPVCLPDAVDAAAAKPEVQPSPATTHAAPEVQEPKSKPRISSRIIDLSGRGVRGGTSARVPEPLEEQPSEAVPEPVATDDRMMESAATQNTIRTWLEAGRFEEVAQLLLSDRADAVRMQWADQVAARIVAVADGMAAKHPQEADWLPSLASQLSTRRKNLRSERGRAAGRIVGPSGMTGADGEMKEIIKSLDQLMGQVAFDSITAGETAERLIEVMERAVFVLAEKAR